MNCLFCHQSSPKVKRREHIPSCKDCYNWIVKGGDFGLTFKDSKLTQLVSVYYCLKDGKEDDIYYKLIVFFNFNKNTTLITEGYGNGDYKNLLTLPLMPITKEFLENIPNKLKLWLTFS